jgi:predicted dehydrogenase
MGLLHGSILNQLPAAVLVGVMDSDPRRKGLAQSIGVHAPFYSSLEKLLDEIAPDAVFICVPPRFTRDLAEPCHRRGLGVFLEKPMADSRENAARLLDLVRQQPLSIYAVGYVMAHLPTFRRAGEVLAGGTLGGVRSVVASIYVGAVFSRLRSWMGDKQLAGGGAVAQVGSHLIHMLYRLFGRVEEVEATLEYRRNTVEDGSRVLLRFASGFDARVRVAWDVDGYPAHVLSLRVVADEGHLMVSNREIWWGLGPEGREDAQSLHASDFPEHAPFYLGGDGYVEEDLDFVTSLMQGHSPQVPWSEGFAVQQILDAVYRSAETGRPALVGSPL